MQRVVSRILLVFLAGVVFGQSPGMDDPSPGMSLVGPLEVSSVLVQHGSAELYAGFKAFDGDPVTCWVEGKSDAGVGESITARLETEITVDSFVVMNGFSVPDLYQANNRIKKLGVTADNRTFSLPCKDSARPQRFNLSKPITFSVLTLTIEDVYRGSRWNDTCLAEVALYYQGRRLHIETGYEVWKHAEDYTATNIDGIETYILNMTGHITANLKLRLGPSTNRTAVQFTDHEGDGRTYDWIPAGKEVHVVGRTMQPERVGSWHNYWYLIEIPTDDEGSTGIRWAFGEFLEIPR